MNRYEALMQRLANGEQLMIDGATGTEIERHGADTVTQGWSGGGAMTHPDVVRTVHEKYIDAGAKIIISNTFATGLNILQDVDRTKHFDLLNRRSVELACEARAKMYADEVLVAGGISHWSFSRKYPTDEKFHANAKAQASIMADAGADLIMLEMMANIGRMEALINGAQASGLPVWAGLSCEIDDAGTVRLLDGETLVDAVAVVKTLAVPLISIMHTEVEDVNACLDVLETCWDGPVGVYAHSGAFVDPNWVFDDTISPTDYATAAQGWLKRGISLVGGCCGIGKEHIHVLNGRMVVE